jgi:hypothetical protein
MAALAERLEPLLAREQRAAVGTIHLMVDIGGRNLDSGQQATDTERVTAQKVGAIASPRSRMTRPQAVLVLADRTTRLRVFQDAAVPRASLHLADGRVMGDVVR